MKFFREYARLRRESGLTQAQLQQELKKYGISLTVPQLSRLENGRALPTLPQFFALCQILHVQTPLEHFSDFHTPALNSIGMAKVDAYIADLVATGLYKPEADLRRLPLYLLPASAGTGQFLDSDNYELAQVPAEVPDSADFGLPIAGDSMEPRYHSGDIVWVHRQPTIENGEIGIFYLDGESYIKKIESREGQLYLVSLNPAYSPLPVAESSEFRVFGKVVL